VIPQEKDVDVLGERALGAFYTGRNKVLPPAVGVVAEILVRQEIEIVAQRVAIVGLGFLIGRPVASWLMRKAKLRPETSLKLSVMSGFSKYPPQFFCRLFSYV